MLIFMPSLYKGEGGQSSFRIFRFVNIRFHKWYHPNFLIYSKVNAIFETLKKVKGNRFSMAGCHFLCNFAAGK